MSILLLVPGALHTNDCDAPELEFTIYRRPGERYLIFYLSTEEGGRDGGDGGDGDQLHTALHKHKDGR